LIAIRDVRKKQYKAGIITLWDIADGAIRFFWDDCSAFNDPGNESLYRALVAKISEKHARLGKVALN